MTNPIQFFTDRFNLTTADIESLLATALSKGGDYAKAFYGPPSPAAMSNPLINALYCTLLHAVGAPRDEFNHAPGLKEKPEQFGPLAELLA